MNGWTDVTTVVRVSPDTAPYGEEVPKMPLDQIGRLSAAAGIHPDVFGPCRRAAHKLNWFIMFRPIKPTAMFHVGDFDKLPKPMAVKAKADKETGMVKLKDQQDFEAALKDGRLDPIYAEKNGLKLDRENFLVNQKGQRFFSDMDLYEVLHGTTGRQVRLGSGESETQGLANRRDLDMLINILRPLGTDFGLVQHGPERQWVKHDHDAENHEPITVFCPSGEVLLIDACAAKSFVSKLSMDPQMDLTPYRPEPTTPAPRPLPIVR